MSSWNQFKSKVRERWQLPVLAVSLVLLAIAALRLRPPVSDLPLPRAAEILDQNYLASGLYGQALMACDALLAREDETEPDRAMIHLRRGRALYGLSATRDSVSVERGDEIVDAFTRATNYGQTLTADDLFKVGRALEWKKRPGDALDFYERAIDRGFEDALALRRHMYGIARDVLDRPLEQLEARLRSFLVEVGDVRLDDRLWAVEELFFVLEEMGSLNRVATLLQQEHDRFAESDLSDSFAFLEGLLLLRQGAVDEAELTARAILSRVDRDHEVYPKAGWLLGRSVLRDAGPKRPTEAIAVFEQVLHYVSRGEYVAACFAGVGEAEALLERHGRAAAAFQRAIDMLPELSRKRIINVEILRVSLSMLSNQMASLGSLRAALDYAGLAASLLDRGNVEQATMLLHQYAQLQERYADELDAEAREVLVSVRAPAITPSEEARELYADAADTYMHIARLNIVNEPRSADASWRAANLVSKAGELRRAVALYQAFASERPDHPLVARALLRSGRLLHRIGELREAVAVYQEVYRRFPRVIDGARALIPLAEAYLAMGPSHYELAEKTLRIVLEESEVFTPEAPEFSDALFLLGDALARRREFEQAISVLEEALQRYPRDPRRSRVRSLLADAYRRSAEALRDEIEQAAFAGEVKRIREESMRRYRKARGLYREAIDDYELRDPAELTRVESVFLRHAYLYEADCYFATQEYERALKLYEEAVGAFKDQPAGLAAYVQIINCHVFLGETDEARAAHARALVLTDSIPREGFVRSASPETRADWRRYFDWLGDSGLF